MFYYPEIQKSDVEVLRKMLIVVENIRQNPDYINDKACQYTPEVKVLFGSLGLDEKPNVSHEINDTPSEPVSIQDFDLLNTSLEVIQELQTLKSSLKNLSTNEKISTYRLLVTQLEKVFELSRQAEDLDHYRLFKSQLFDTLERHLTPAQISEFIEDFRLEVNDKQKM